MWARTGLLRSAPPRPYLFHIRSTADGLVPHPFHRGRACSTSVPPRPYLFHIRSTPFPEFCCLHFIPSRFRCIEGKFLNSLPLLLYSKGKECYPSPSRLRGTDARFHQLRTCAGHLITASVCCPDSCPRGVIDHHIPIVLQRQSGTFPTGARRPRKVWS
jgi:hypothetical protein